MMKQTVDEFNRAKSYEIIVRMADGSSRVIDDANPARWRTGERLIVIGGVRPSNR
jgi:outer membrane lipoprotein SlyB